MECSAPCSGLWFSDAQTSRRLFHCSFICFKPKRLENAASFCVNLRIAFSSAVPKLDTNIAGNFAHNRGVNSAQYSGGIWAGGGGYCCGFNNNCPSMGLLPAWRCASRNSCALWFACRAYLFNTFGCTFFKGNSNSYYLFSVFGCNDLATSPPSRNI